jgi:hypothetical protein
LQFEDERAFGYVIAFFYQYFFDNAIGVDGHFGVHFISADDQYNLFFCDLVARFDEDFEHFAGYPVAERGKFKFVCHLLFSLGRQR